jgi:hypothetical protein
MNNITFLMTLKFNLSEFELCLSDGFRCNLNFWLIKAEKVCTQTKQTMYAS